MNLISQEKADIISHAKEDNRSSELAKSRGEYDSVVRKAHDLEAEVDASQNLAREVCSERDELRGVLDKKLADFQIDDDESASEMRALLAEFSALYNTDVADTAEKSSVELLRNFVHVTEKNVERLAKRAEVSHPTPVSASHIC